MFSANMFFAYFNAPREGAERSKPYRLKVDNISIDGAFIPREIKVTNPASARWRKLSVLLHTALHAAAIESEAGSTVSAPYIICHRAIHLIYALLRDVAPA